MMKSKILVTGALLSGCAGLLSCSGPRTDETILNELTLQDFLSPEGPDLGELQQKLSGPHVAPYAQCVTDNLDGTYTARWGYNSSYSATEDLPINTTNRFFFLDPLGKDVFGRQNAGQPTRFASGDHPAAFETTFEAASVWWIDGNLAWATPFTEACTTPAAPTCSVGTPTTVTIDMQGSGRGSFHSVEILPNITNNVWKHASNHQTRWTGTCIDDGVNCLTPNGTLEANRQYQTWDLSSLNINQEVIAANMVSPHAGNSYIDGGNGTTETVVFYSADTAANALADGRNHPAYIEPAPGEPTCACIDNPNTTTVLPIIFEDLGTGEVFGSVTVDASVNGTEGPDIPLNAVAISAINNARGSLWNMAAAQISGGGTFAFGLVERVWRGGGPLARLELTVCQ